MKNQRMKTEARNFRFLSVAIVLLMLATLICGFTVMTSAAGTQIEVGLSDLDLSGLKQDASGNYYKVYDGNVSAPVSVKTTNAELGIAAGDDVKVIATATFNSKNVTEASTITVSFTLEGADSGKYTAPASFPISAKIHPKTLTWAANGSATATYQPGKTTYDNLSVTVPALNQSGIVSGDTVTAATAPAVAVNGVTAIGDYLATVPVALSGADKDNYTIAALNVKVKIEKIVITKVEWAPSYSFVWGDEAANNLELVGYDAANNAYNLVIEYPENYGNVGSHTVKALLPDSANMTWAQDNSVSTQKQVVITKKQYTVALKDQTFIGNVGLQGTPTKYQISVEGDLPASIRSGILYSVDGKYFNGATEYGVYNVTAKLPSANGNVEFVDADGNVVTELTAKMTINRQFVAAANGDVPYQMILIRENGFAADLTASVKLADQLARKAISGFPVHVGYELSVSGNVDGTFTILVPISDELYHKNCEDPTVGDIYLYEGSNSSMKKVSEMNGYTVTLGEGYYRIEGVTLSAENTLTFVIAPEYNTPFWISPIGIALLVLIVLAFIALLILVGLYLRRVRDTGDNEVLIVDTEGDVPAVEPVEIEDKTDADEHLEETADNIAENLDVAAEEEAADTEGVEDAVAESMDELMEEVEEIELDKEEETDPTEDMAEDKAAELADTEAEEDAEAEADEDALREAVAAAMEENFNESADTTDAVAIVAEDESDEITPEDFKAVVDAIVSDAMCHTMVLPEEIFAEEATEEVAEEATEEVAEEATEEVAEEATEEVAEEATEEVAEEATEEVAEEATEEVAEEATEEVAEEATEEVVVEEMSGEDICAVVADSVAEAFELVTVDGVVPAAVEGTTLETITNAVKDAADANVPETWTEEMAAAVTEAVVEELAARLLVEEAVEAFAVVEEAPETDDDDDDDDDENYGGFGSMPLDFIDAIAEADKYAEMLEQERRGEVRIVTRYRRSFQSRLIQSQGNVQDYYNILKNALLSYKGVKNRISWNYEAFNRGRVHVAKINAKTKTLYLYLALDPEELKDTKYGIVDVSSKKKYASVPVLMKIKGERKFKYALELIAKLCGENLELPLLEKPEEDYHIPYQTTEELVQAGVVKKLVASVPVSAYGAESTEEAPVEAASATAEAQEVSFVEPTTAPAVEAAAEEVATEAPAEETPAAETVEEVAADAEATDADTSSKEV